jgi:hypothetical protein
MGADWATRIAVASMVLGLPQARHIGIKGSSRTIEVERVRLGYILSTANRW